MPGVTVTTRATPGTAERITPAGAAYFVVGQAERGSTTGYELVRSAAEFEEKLGGRVTYGALYDDLVTFFAEGGSRAYVARVVGTTPTTGTRTLLATTGGLTTIVLNAKSAGAWSANLSVEVVAGVVANTFTVRIYYAGALVESYPDNATPAAAVAAINGRSTYVTAVDSGNVTATPGNNPAVLAPTALSAGADDRATIVAGNYVTALERFPSSLGAGAVAIPGQAASAVGAGLIAHARAYRRVALMAPANGATITAAKVEALALRTVAGAEYAGMFAPWIKVPDGAGGLRTIDPVGYVAAARARAFRTEGPWRAPAGEVASATYVADVVTAYTRAEADTLTDARINPIVTRGGSVRNYGWRSLSLDNLNFALLTGRDLLNVVAAEAEAALEQFVFRTIDGKGHLFAEVEGELVAIVEPIRAAGGLYQRVDEDGTPSDLGYLIDTGPSVNTALTLAANELRASLALRVSPIGELVTLTITKVAFESAL